MAQPRIIGGDAYVKASNGRDILSFLDGVITVLRSGALRLPGGAHLVSVAASLDSITAEETATLENAPTAGDPVKWIAIDDNGTTLYIPAWAAPE